VIPSDFIFKPKLYKPKSTAVEMESSNEIYQWYYEGGSGKFLKCFLIIKVGTYLYPTASSTQPLVECRKHSLRVRSQYNFPIYNSTRWVGYFSISQLHRIGPMQWLRIVFPLNIVRILGCRPIEMRIGPNIRGEFVVCNNIYYLISSSKSCALPSLIIPYFLF